MAEAGAVEDGLPPELKVAQSALSKQPVTEIKNMLRDVDLPTCGSKGDLVVRIIRHLNGLAPTRSDKQLLEYKEAQAAKKDKLAAKERADAEKKIAAEASAKVVAEEEAAALARAREYEERKKAKKEKKLEKKEKKLKDKDGVKATAEAAATEPAKPAEDAPPPKRPRQESGEGEN